MRNLVSIYECYTGINFNIPYVYTCIYNTKTIICLFTNKLNLAFLLLHMTFDGLFQERNDFNLVQLA